MLPKEDVAVEGVRIRMLQESDLPRVVQWFNDPEFCEGLGREPGLTLKQEEEWYAHIELKPDVLVFAIENEKGEHVGNIALNRINAEKGNAMVSLAISRENWRKGYAKKALKAIIQYASDVLGLEEIYATIYPFNQRSQNLFRSAGFVEDKKRKERHQYQGREWTLTVLSFDI
ncbi:MAG: GNAT family N-acetyltransferase [Candidatus Thermoplasmatota archaeon]|nr:GNAT family N-acetyltransferase [Candidatus Thermoplasmatota archaeon]